MYFDNVYTEQKQSNGDVLLIKKNLLINDYMLHRRPNGDILLKKVMRIDPDDVGKWNFAGSKIQKALFNNDYKSQLVKPSFKNIYETAHEHVGDGAQIIKHSALNIKTIEYTDRGFKWYPELGISIQGVDFNRALVETITQCQKNDITLELTILIQDQLVMVTV